MTSLRIHSAISATALLAFGLSANAASLVINNLNSAPSSSIAIGGATTSIVNYDGVGAARLTTGLDNNDQATILISGSFGNFGDLLTDPDLSFEYRFQKAPDAAGAPAAAAFAAPALSLVLYDENFAGDGYLTIKYEHYWNIGNAVVPTDSWIIANLDYTQGAMWSSSGLGLANSSGGPPLFNLQNILDGTASSTAALSDDLVLDFSALPDAGLIGIQLNVGSYNQGQDGYVDYLSMTTGAGTTTYDFQVQVVPVPAAAWLYGAALVCLVWMRRKPAA
jgi:hypothetical protein